MSYKFVIAGRCPDAAGTRAREVKIATVSYITGMRPHPHPRRRRAVLQVMAKTRYY